MARLIKHQLTYRVPNGDICNGTDCMGCPTDAKCRFAVERGRGKNKHWECVMHCMTLQNEGNKVYKCSECMKRAGIIPTIMAWKVGYVGEAVDEPTQPTITPEMVQAQVNKTIKQYNKAVQGLVAQGYPLEMAMAAAQECITQTTAQ